ncbi:DUF4381 domain-containing protein [Pseudomonas sp. N040]|uniref:DUF4381 domain-containing protein n=1 Tax=Pseudomonas sp. N040 TaxID=2785325 RepID=UPI0018A326B4|nr:DUF4381 domain-containing protein [Pseudomonas sp. N040]MBF7731278.1 DUF4381 domain-containing protein [Pseudomonas sp. N040]MBW7014921.1 DUF4381 domain-containing protein [Pseudomonas sp. N040]
MNPLDQLQPPITPPAIAWWPPAPGWWLLLIGLPLLFCGLWWLRGRLRRKPRQPTRAEELDPLRQAALHELAQLQPPAPGEPAGLWLQQLNALLKRLCREHYPNQHSHTLSGRAWLAFLDSRCPAAGLTRWMVLVDGGYRAQCKLDAGAIEGLNKSVDTWIRKHV